MRATWALTILAAAIAGGAQAAPPAPQPAVQLSLAHAAYGPARGFEASDAARTSVDHRFSAGGPTASAGFLCGLQPGAVETGAAAAHGYDPQGRFVGARLRFAFR